jgi:hypothetical protein
MGRVFFKPQEYAQDFDQVKLPGEASGKYTESYPSGIPMVMPVRFKLSGWADWWTIPIEPEVTVSGGNVIAKRTVAKAKYRGTIKERWTQDDYKVTIDGDLINPDSDIEFPEADLAKLRQVCEAVEAVQVDCDMLKYFDVYKIVVETYDFPFTPGDNKQRYSLKCLSDDLTDVLTEEDQL